MIKLVACLTGALAFASIWSDVALYLLAVAMITLNVLLCQEVIK